MSTALQPRDALPTVVTDDGPAHGLPTFSVVIPCYNVLPYTITTIQSVLAHSTEAELVIVNDGSTDETAGYLATLGERFAPGGITRLRILTNPVSRGFTVAVNQGAAVAEGQYVVLLNNDVLVTPFWLGRLRFALDTFHEHLPIGRFGLVGPATNYAGGPQMVPNLPTPFPTDQVAEYAEFFHRGNQGNWMYTGFLSGFCLMVRKDCWDELGGFDEQFTPGGFEDNDLCKRAYAAGWKALIAGDTFVYHHGTKSTSQPDRAFMQGGLHNRGKYYAKWFEANMRRQRIVAGYRVKNGARWLKDSLEKTASVVDGIVILDDGSTDETPSIAQAHPGVLQYVRHDRPFQELRDRNELWSLMRSQTFDGQPADWGLILDADEVLEDKVTDEYLQRLCHPIHPDVHGYILKVDTFWRGREKIRTDGTFGNLRGVRLVRFADGQCLWTPHPTGLHCGNVPLLPPHWLALSNCHIKHYGFEDMELARTKWAFYQQVDPVKNPVMVGGDGSYSHLIDESELSLRDWQEQNTLGLCMIARNEASLLPQFFERNHFWALFDQIVLVDCGSTDDTAKIAEIYGAEVYAYKTKRPDGKMDNFAKARNFAKSKLQTRWVLHLDADEFFLQEDLFALLRCLERPVVAYLTGVANHQPDGTATHSESFRLFRNIPDLFYTQLVHESLEDSIRRLNKPRIEKLPVTLHHQGYLRGSGYVQGKLEHYAELNEQQLALDPADPRPFFNLALHYLNDGEREKGIEYLQEAVKRNPAFYQPVKELGLEHLREARGFFEQCERVIADGHVMKGHIKEIADWLRTHAGPPIAVGQPKKGP